MAAAEPAPGGDPNPLAALLRRCTVRVDVGGEFLGSGFFVAPGEVLTCAHVVHGRDGITVWWDGRGHPVTLLEALPDLEVGDLAARFYPLPDVALLRLADPVPLGHPCVRFDLAEPVTGSRPDVLRLFGWTRGEHARGELASSSAATEYEGPLDERGWRLLKLARGRVLGGFSGAALVNTRSHGVCGLVESTRDERSDLGGFGVPLAAFLANLPGLRERNEAFHGRDRSWALAVEAEERLAARRSGDWERLPLVAPRLALDWEPGGSRADLLHPRYGVVPFVGREGLLDELMLWRERDDRLGVVVLAGAGGSGKTRTALELCLAAGRAGWSTGLVSLLDSDPGPELERLADWPGRLLVAVDYAETRPDLVAGLLRRLQRRPQRPPARVVLVVRQAIGKVGDLFADNEVRVELGSVLRRAEPVHLDRDEHELDRAALFARAVTAFAGLVGGPGPSERAPTLRATHFARPLVVLAAALLTAEDPDLDVDQLSAGELLGEVLDRHEAQYWESWNRRLGAGLHRDDQRRAVALAALLGAGTEEETLAVVRLLSGFAEAGGERVRAIARWLSHLYGPGRLDAHPAIPPLEPDLLAETLVARELATAPQLIGAALDAASDRQLTRALTVLSRASVGREALAAPARAALDDRLEGLVRTLADGEQPDEELIAAVRLAVSSLVPWLGAVAAMDALPAVSTTLAALAAEVTSLAVDAYRAAADHDIERFLPELARSLIKQSVRLGALGRPEDALTAIDEAVTIGRRLATAHPDTHLPDLASSLNNQSLQLGVLGRPEDALTAITEAVTIGRRLAATHPDTYLPDLAASLNNQSLRLGDLGRPEDALTAITEAISLYRQLATAHPDVYLPGLAGSLNNQSACLRDLGRLEDALTAITEAINLYRRLAATHPDTHLPNLAAALNTVSACLGDLGQPEDALTAITEAVTLYRRLAATHPDTHLPNLAAALNNQSVRLSDLHRPEDALTAITEAVDVYRWLAATRPDTHLPDLARVLNNQSTCLNDLGRHEETLTVSDEAVTLYQQLAATRPDTHLPDLAGALNNQSTWLGVLRRPVDALTVITEAVSIYRELTATRPDTHLPNLARALTTLSACLSDLGRPEDALTAITEAITLYRRLAATRPDTHLPSLARALSNHSVFLGDLGRHEEALTTSDESVTVYRRLAATRLDPHLPELARALHNQSVRLRDLDRPKNALTAITEAVTLYRRLAATRPDTHLPSLTRALSNQARLLSGFGRGHEAQERFGEVLGDHDGNEWATGVLLLSRAGWHRDAGDMTAAVFDGWSALGSLGRDPVRMREVRILLKVLRDDSIAAFDRVWDEAVGGDQPVWLRHHHYDRSLEEQLSAWIETPTWEDSEALLAEHASALLTDSAEAALEHLIDVNPQALELGEHLAILQAARADGIEVTYAELRRSLREADLTDRLIDWVETPTWEESRRFLDEHAADLVTDEAEALLGILVEERPDAPELLAHLGLLGLCRLDGPDAAYAALGGAERPAEPAALPTDEHLPRALASARLHAGLHNDDGDLHLRHALAALAAGHAAEADRAITRCAETSASWERRSYARHLTDLATTHPTHAAALARLRTLLTAGG